MIHKLPFLLIPSLFEGYNKLPFLEHFLRAYARPLKNFENKNIKSLKKSFQNLLQYLFGKIASPQRKQPVNLVIKIKFFL